MESSIEDLPPGAVELAPRRLVKAGELAKKTGTTRQSLHLYVQLGLLRPLSMTKGGQRLFEDEVSAVRVDLIQKLCTSGYSLREIKEIFFKDR